MPHWEFASTEPVSLRVRTTAGSVTVAAEATELITVDVRPSRSGRHAEELADEVRVEFTGDRLQVTEPSNLIGRLRDAGLDVFITVPEGSRCEVETASAEISCLGEFASLNVKTASGALKAATVDGDAQITSISGRVTVAKAGTMTVKTASGSIELGEVTGALQASSVSGRVLVGSAGGPVTAQTSSGRISLDRLSQDTVQINSVSGDVTVQVIPDTDVYLDLASLSGRVRSELDPASDPAGGAAQATLQLHCRTVSGSIRVTRAPSTTPAQSVSS
jgi:Putative adhesin